MFNNIFNIISSFQGFSDITFSGLYDINVTCVMIRNDTFASYFYKNYKGCNACMLTQPQYNFIDQYFKYYKLDFNDWSGLT